MEGGATVELLDSAYVLTRHVDALLVLDPALATVHEQAGSFEIRTAEPGFAGLARIVTGQQLSTASAAAIWGRVAALEGALTPEGYLQLSEAEIRAAGFSDFKYRTVRGIAEALVGGDFAFSELDGLDADSAIATLTRLKGIGPWTAELYLMFSAAHPDVFPAGDLALQWAVAWADGDTVRPSARALKTRAERWAPYRSAAALLFWRYYRAVRKKEGLLI